MTNHFGHFCCFAKTNCAQKWFGVLFRCLQKIKKKFFLCFKQEKGFPPNTHLKTILPQIPNQRQKQAFT